VTANPPIREIMFHLVILYHPTSLSILIQSFGVHFNVIFHTFPWGLRALQCDEFSFTGETFNVYLRVIHAELLHIFNAILFHLGQNYVYISSKDNVL
jgi:hypothetical protein